MKLSKPDYLLGLMKLLQNLTLKYLAPNVKKGKRWRWDQGRQKPASGNFLRKQKGYRAEGDETDLGARHRIGSRCGERKREKEEERRRRRRWRRKGGSDERKRIGGRGD